MIKPYTIMSEDLFEKIHQGIIAAQREMVERKAKLGESIVIADENGQPKIIPASEALNLYR